MSPFLILHNDLRKNNGRSNMTYGRWHCGKTLALNQTHSGMLQLKCLGVLHVRSNPYPEMSGQKSE